MIEVGVDFNSTQRISDILFKLKRQLKKINILTLGYIWLVDKGEYGNMHFHLVVAIERVNIKGVRLQTNLNFLIESI
jgi:hypothetical protein